MHAQHERIHLGVETPFFAFTFNYRNGASMLAILKTDVSQYASTYRSWRGHIASWRGQCVVVKVGLNVE